MQLNAMKIRQLRMEKAWTQQQLAEICGLSLRTIQRVEVHGIASLETSKALAAAFNIERLEIAEQYDAIAKTNAPRVGSTLLPVITFIAGVVVGVLLLKLVNLL